MTSRAAMSAELVERVARLLEPDIMAHKGEAWAWRQDQERKYARRLLDETGVDGLLAERERLTRELQAIANAVRLGPIDSVIAWRSLAESCQITARAALAQPPAASSEEE